MFLRRIGYTFEPYACQTPNAMCVVTQHPGHSPCRGAEYAGENKHVADFIRSISMSDELGTCGLSEEHWSMRIFQYIRYDGASSDVQSTSISPHLTVSFADTPVEFTATGKGASSKFSS